MKLIIAGGRDLYSMESLIYWFLYNSGGDLEPTEIVSGGASGIDESGEAFAKTNEYPVKVFEADWETHGRAAGPIRNKQMAEYADALLLIWNGESPGSKSMRSEMAKLNKPIYEIILKSSK